MSLFLVDLYSIIFKSFYAIPSLRTSKGYPTNAILGTLKSIIKIIKQFNVQNLIIVLDTGKKTFRNEIFPDYKANRLEAPDELKIQFSVITDLLKQLGFFLIEKEGLEADDLIFSISKKFNNQNIFIFSSDKDLYQLVSDKVKLISESKKGLIIIDENEVKNKFNVLPSQIVDFLALTGDSSDNIPGVKGIGPKTAADLLNEFLSLDNIYSSLDKIKSNSIKQKLIDGKDSAYLSKKLVELKYIDLNFDSSSFANLKLNLNNALEQLKELELFSVINDLKNLEFKDDLFQNNVIQSPEKNEEILNVEFPTFYFSLNSAVSLFNKIKNSKKYFFYSFYINNVENAIITDFNNYIIFKEPAQNFILKIFEQPNSKFIFFNTKEFIKKFISNISLEQFEKILKNSFDISIALFLLNSDNSNLSLIRIINQFYNKNIITNFNNEKNENSLIKFTQYLISHLNDIEEILSKKLEEFNLLKLYYEIELPLIIILFKMEQYGIKINYDYLLKIEQQIKNDIEEIKKEIYKYADNTINLNSPKQISELLFEKYNLPKLKKIKSGYCTDNEVLEELKSFHKLPELLLEYRNLTKLENTYIANFKELTQNQRIYTTFNQCGATTGRIISINPNLQNIPVEKEERYSIRKIFIADENCKFIISDYSQIELRILAHLSNDERMIEAFLNDEDIHIRTAKEIFGENIQVDNHIRRLAKTINFGIIYGMSAFKLGKDLNIPVSEAKKYIIRYFEKYNGIKKYFDEVKEFAKKNGYVETIFNRRRYIPQINDRNKNIREAAVRMAINMPVQGSAADILKLAMLKIFQELKKYRTKLLLTIHDELIFNSPLDEIQEVQQIIKNQMENVIKLRIPLKVKISIRDSWGE